jgi:hypothetical protein
MARGKHSGVFPSLKVLGGCMVGAEDPLQNQPGRAFALRTLGGIPAVMLLMSREGR